MNYIFKAPWHLFSPHLILTKIRSQKECLGQTSSTGENAKYNPHGDNLVKPGLVLEFITTRPLTVGIFLPHSWGM